MLAENTDGIALVNSNDLDKQMRRLAADLTSYYLIGYSSTNAKLDGGFRTIRVRVSRPAWKSALATATVPQAPRNSAAGREAAATGCLQNRRRPNAELGLLAREGRSQPRRRRAHAEAREAAPGEPMIFVADRRPATCSSARAPGILANRPSAFGDADRRCHRVDGSAARSHGKTLPVPIATGERTDAATGQKWLTADLTLAPLGAGDYAIELTVQRGGRAHEDSESDQGHAVTSPFARPRVPRRATKWTASGWQGPPTPRNIRRC